MFCAEQGVKAEDIQPFFALLLIVNPKAAITVLHHFLGEMYAFLVARLQNGKTDDLSNGMVLALIASGYLFEDLMNMFQLHVDTQKTLSTVARLILVLAKANLLYFSLPTISLAELQAITPELAAKLLETAGEQTAAAPGWGRPEISHKFALREGGLVRIMITLLLKMAKADRDVEALYSVAMIRFFLTKDKTSKERVRKCASLEKSESPKKKKRKKHTKYSFLDLLLVSDPAKQKSHAGLMESLAKRVAHTFGSVLGRPCGKSWRPDSMFESGSFQVLYIASELVHLIHFELLGIKSCACFPDETRLDKLLTEGAAAFSFKAKALVELVDVILCFPAAAAVDEKTTPDRLLQSLFDQLTIRPDSSFNPSSQGIYSPLDEPANVKIPAESASPPSLSAQTCFDFYTSLPERLAAAKSIEAKCNVLSQFTLCNAYIRMLPCILFFTVDNLATLDTIICEQAETTAKIMRAATFAVPTQDYTKRVSDMSPCVDSDLAAFPVHREKLGIIISS